MKIAVLSDTHDQMVYIEKVVEQINQAGVGLVVHCGDWVSPFILYSFRNLKAPIKGVFGNNDGDKFRHLGFRDKLGIDVTYEDRFLEMEVEGRLIAVFHGDYQGIVDALVQCGKYDAVFHGHTHQRVDKQIGKTLSLNPGSLLIETLGQPFGASFAFYDTETNQATHILL